MKDPEECLMSPKNVDGWDLKPSASMNGKHSTSITLQLARWHDSFNPMKCSVYVVRDCQNFDRNMLMHIGDLWILRRMLFAIGGCWWNLRVEIAILHWIKGEAWFCNLPMTSCTFAEGNLCTFARLYMFWPLFSPTFAGKWNILGLVKQKEKKVT